MDLKPAKVCFDKGIAFNESVLASFHIISEDSDIGEEYPELVGAVMLTNIERQWNGIKRRASDVLNAICKWADNHGTTLVLYPAASGDLKQADLIAWYERNGFQTISCGPMVRFPA